MPAQGRLEGGPYHPHICLPSVLGGAQISQGPGHGLVTPFLETCQTVRTFMNSSAVYLGEGVWEGLVSLTGGFIMCS